MTESLPKRLVHSHLLCDQNNGHLQNVAF